MIDNINMLINKFNKIKNMGWVPSINNGLSGIGLTFENLLGVPQNDFEIPDFHGIELKVKRECSHAYITLFSAKPDGPHYHEVKRLQELYGYPHYRYKQYKVLNNSVFANNKNKIGTSYYFQLHVDRQNEKLFLLIYDKNGIIIENEVFWYFDTLKEKLERKLKVLAYVKAYSKYENNQEYFKYYKIIIYKLTNFETFINLLEKGIIRVTFKLNIYLSGPKKGNICDHGTSFDIKGMDLIELFDLWKN